MKRNRPLRIAMYDPSGQGGICHYTYQLAQNLGLTGSDVTLVTADNYELNHLPRSFKIIFLFKKSWIKRLMFGLNAPSDYRQRAFTQADKKIFALALLRDLRLRILWLKAAFLFLWTRPDLIHLQWSADRNQEHFFINLLKLLGFTIVYTVHDLLPLEADGHLDYDALDKTYRKVDALIVHSESNKKELVSAFDIDPNKIYVIPHGSNDLFFSDREIAKERAREELGLSRKNKVILFFGIIKPYKGLEYSVEAFREVREQVDNVMLLIVGKIADREPEGFKYYSDLIARLSACEDVLCVEDYVSLEKIALYFAASDVVALPYVKNYTSGVLLSAYAAGRPVVVTDTGGLKEGVQIGKTGFVVPPKDTKALARAIIETIESSERCDEMGRYAKLFAEKNYSWSSVASKTMDLYRQLALEAVVADTASQVIAK